MKKKSFRLDVKGNFFTQILRRHWNRLHREAAVAPYMQAFKARLNGALAA